MSEAPTNGKHDVTTHRIVVACLGACVLLTGAGITGLAMLGHELRNPLAPIRNSTQILRLKGSPDPVVLQAYDMVERQVRQLTRLVDDLLDMSRINQGKIELRKEHVELAALVDRALETTRPLFDERRHQVHV